MARIFQVDAVLIDTGILYALADKNDKWHEPAVAFAAEFDGRLVAPSPVLPEACYLINKFLGVSAEVAFVGALINREIVIEHFNASDLERALDIMKNYADINIGFVDSVSVAIAERLRISRILTTDRKHFGTVKPRHCKAFVMLP